MTMTCLHWYISIYSKLILFTDFKHVSHFIWLCVQIIEQKTGNKWVYALIGLCCITIQVLNTRVCFLDIWYAPFTSVYYNLEHGVAIITESFSPLNLNYTTSFVKVWIRSDMTSHAIPDTVHFSCITAGKNQFELITASLNHVLSTWKDSTSWTLLEFPIFPPDGL